MNQPMKFCSWRVILPIYIALIGICLVGTSSTVFAEDVVTVVIKKQEEKAKYRWNLSDWLWTRDRMRLQDLWLAYHSPSPYEYYIGANYQFNKYIGGNSYEASEVYFGAVATLVHLEGRLEYGPNVRVQGILGVRLVGRHDQATNLLVQAGLLSTETPSDAYRNAFVGSSLTFYLARFFGLQGYHRYFFPSTPNNSGANYSGHRLQAGAFVDFRFVRIYGDYYVDSGSGPVNSGAMLGTKIYF